jgi:hypothetical protein
MQRMRDKASQRRARRKVFVSSVWMNVAKGEQRNPAKLGRLCIHRSGWMDGKFAPLADANQTFHRGSVESQERVLQPPSRQNAFIACCDGYKCYTNGTSAPVCARFLLPPNDTKTVRRQTTKNSQMAIASSTRIYYSTRTPCMLVRNVTAETPKDRSTVQG